MDTCERMNEEGCLHHFFPAAIKEVKYFIGISFKYSTTLKIKDYIIDSDHIRLYWVIFRLFNQSDKEYMVNKHLKSTVLWCTEVPISAFCSWGIQRCEETELLARDHTNVYGKCASVLNLRLGPRLLGHSVFFLCHLLLQLLAVSSFGRYWNRT